MEARMPSPSSGVSAMAKGSAIAATSPVYPAKSTLTFPLALVTLTACPFA